MAERILSWEALARMLADRLQYQDFCDNGHADISEGLTEGCANCDDREAMRQFRRKVPPVKRPALPTITVDALRAQSSDLYPDCPREPRNPLDCPGAGPEDHRLSDL